MADTPNANKFRAAMDVLLRGRDSLVESIADEVIDQEGDLLDGGYRFNEFVEVQGTRLHLLSLLIAQLELSAQTVEEREMLAWMPPEPEPDPEPAPPRKRTRGRARKNRPEVPTEGTPEDC